MTSSHHAPDVQGFTHATMAGTEGSDIVRWSESLESWSQFGSGSAIRPREVGVASNRRSAVLR